MLSYLRTLNIAAELSYVCIYSYNNIRIVKPLINVTSEIIESANREWYDPVWMEELKIVKESESKAEDWAQSTRRYRIQLDVAR